MQILNLNGQVTQELQARNQKMPKLSFLKIFGSLLVAFLTFFKFGNFISQFFGLSTAEHNATSLQSNATSNLSHQNSILPSTSHNTAPFLANNSSNISECELLSKSGPFRAMAEFLAPENMPLNATCAEKQQIRLNFNQFQNILLLICLIIFIVIMIFISQHLNKKKYRRVDLNEIYAS